MSGVLRRALEGASARKGVMAYSLHGFRAAAGSTRLYHSNGPDKPYKKKFYDKTRRTERKPSLLKRCDVSENQLPLSVDKRNEEGTEKESVPLEERIPKDSELYKLYNELRDVEKEMEKLDNEFNSLFTIENLKKLAEEDTESEYVSESSSEFRGPSSEESDSDSEYRRPFSSSDDMDYDDDLRFEESD